MAASQQPPPYNTVSGGADAAQTTQPAQNTQPIPSVQSAQTTQPTQPVQPAQPAKKSSATTIVIVIVLFVAFIIFMVIISHSCVEGEKSLLCAAAESLNSGAQLLAALASNLMAVLALILAIVFMLAVPSVSKAITGSKWYQETKVGQSDVSKNVNDKATEVENKRKNPNEQAPGNNTGPNIETGGPNKIPVEPNNPDTKHPTGGTETGTPHNPVKPKH